MRAVMFGALIALAVISDGSAARIRIRSGNHAQHVREASQWLESKGYTVQPTKPVAITGQRNAGVTLLKTAQGETFVVKSVAAIVHGNPNNEIADLQKVIALVNEVKYEEQLAADPELPLLTLPVKLMDDFYIMKAATGKAVQDIIDDQSLEAFNKPRNPACGSAISATITALEKFNALGLFHHDALSSNIYYDDASGRVTLIDLPDIKGPTATPYSDVDRFTDSCETYLRTRKGKTPTKTEECGDFVSGSTFTCIAQNARTKPECRGRSGGGTKANGANVVDGAKPMSDGASAMHHAKVSNDPCAAFRAKHPDIQYDPTTGNCVVPAHNSDPCAAFRAKHPNIQYDPATKTCVVPQPQAKLQQADPCAQYRSMYPKGRRFSVNGVNCVA